MAEIKEIARIARATKSRIIEANTPKRYCWYFLSLSMGEFENHLAKTGIFAPGVRATPIKRLAFWQPGKCAGVQ